jgi:predicted small lipoprotein YifL
MKTVLRIAIASLFLLFLCACGNKGDLVLPDPPEAATTA